MALDPNIILNQTIPDYGNTLVRGFMLGQKIRQGYEQNKREEELQPTRQRLLEAKLQTAEAQAAGAPAEAEAKRIANEMNQQRLADLQQQAQILRSATTANSALPAIQRKDLAAFQQVLGKSNLPEDQRDYLSLLGEANRWDELKTIADKEIETAKLTGLFGKEGAQYVSDLQRYMTASPEEQAKMIAFKRGDQIVNLGGGLQGVRDAATGAIIPVQAGELPMPPSPTGAMPLSPSGVDLNTPIEQPPAKTTTAAEAFAQNAATMAAAKTSAEREAVRMGDYEKDVQHHKSMKRGLEAVFEDEGYAGLFKDLPQGKLSSAVNNAISTFIGGTKGKDAEARVNQLGRMIIQGVPYDPGAQSNAELDARAALVGSLNDPNVSTNEKIKSIKRYFRFIDERNVSAQENLSDYYERNPAINPPAWYRATKSTQPGAMPDLEYIPGRGVVPFGGQ